MNNIDAFRILVEAAAEAPLNEVARIQVWQARDVLREHLKKEAASQMPVEKKPKVPAAAAGK